MTVAEILKQKNGAVYSIKDSAGIGDAVKLMNEKKIGSLIVDNEKGEVAGILSERDILTKAYPPSEKNVKTVRDIMTPREKIVFGMSDDTVTYVMNIMTNKRLRHLPVLEGDKLSGIVSIGDVVKSVMEQSEAEVRLLREHIMNPYGINLP